MASDRLFEMLAQAKGQPSKALRATEAGGGALENILGGYLQGRQIKQQLGRPEAMARLLNATPQGHEIVQNMGPEGAAAALYDANPKEILDYAGKQADLSQRGRLGMAGINERDTASQRAAQEAKRRTEMTGSIFGGANLSKNIALHEGEVQRLLGENSKLASQIPGGVGGTIQNLIAQGGNYGQYLQDPKYTGIVRQMAQNQQGINQHQALLTPLYKSQGMIPSSLLNNSDMGGINPPEVGGDSAITSNLPGFGQ